MTVLCIFKMAEGMMHSDSSNALAQHTSNDAMMMSQNRENNSMQSASSSSPNTFNVNTIIPPTSNSDGTVGKATSLTLQLPHSSIPVTAQGTSAMP